VEVVTSLSQGRTAAAQCGLFTHKSVPVIFKPACICEYIGAISLHSPSGLCRTQSTGKQFLPFSYTNSVFGKI